MYEEFTKADNNPTDYYINQEELNEYTKNPEHVVLRFDKNSDRKLNIDEFKTLIKNSLGINNSSKGSNTIGQEQAQNRTSSHPNKIPTSENMLQTNNTKTAVTNSIIEKTKNAQAIISEIENALEPITINQINGRRRCLFDEDAILNAYRKITPDNIKEINEANDKLLLKGLWQSSFLRELSTIVSNQAYIEIRNIVGNAYKGYLINNNYINKSDYEVIDKWINDKHENSSFSCHHDMYMERFCSRRLAEINK